MLDKDFQIFIGEMSKVLEEFKYQGEALCHLEVFCLIKPCQYILVNIGTQRMFI
jgi:hypothetical protein